LQSGDLPWTRNQELTFPGVYYYGYVVSISLSGYLADRCSSKRLFIVSLIFEAVAYILLPAMAHSSFEAGVVDLVICGLLAVRNSIIQILIDIYRSCYLTGLWKSGNV